MKTKKFLLAIHGGAGTISQTTSNIAPFHAGLRNSLSAGEVVLKRGGTALDAVQAAVMSLEDCPLFNAGRGSVYTADETHEMDAALMDGATLRAGAVAGVSRIKNPVDLARRVMESSGVVFLTGLGAQRFAIEQGVDSENDDYFHSPYRLAQLKIIQAGGSRKAALDHNIDIDAPLDEAKKFGTVGAVALDIHGHLAAAVSTGGMTNKRPGRVGDSPLIGAGFYANDATCAVSATGTGEMFMRAVAAHDIHSRMAYKGESLEVAARTVMHQTLTRLGAEGGLIAIDAMGNVCMPFNSRGMYRGLTGSEMDLQTMIYGANENV
jgi:L-asparaginase / beta-aspartyl-peptidase